MTERLCKHLALYWFPLVLFCIGIFVMSAHPAPQHIPNVPNLDKLLHFTAYAILGILFYRALNTLPLKHHIRLLIGVSVLLACVYGISDEIHQAFVPHRDSDIMDVLADGLGSVFGVMTYYILNRRRRVSSGQA